MKPEEKNINDKFSFLADHFMKVYDRQILDFDVFDRKISWFIIFEIALFQILLTQNKIIIASILFISICFGIYIVFPKKVERCYLPKNILDKFWDNDSGDFDIENAQAQMVTDISNAISINSKTLLKKSKNGKIMICFFMFAILILLLSYFDICNLIFYLCQYS